MAEEPEAPKPVSVPEDANINVSEAARIMRKARRDAEQPEPTSAPEVAAEPEQPPAPVAEGTDPPQEAPGEPDAAEPAELPPIAPPRSWTKDAKERWSSLPRETQEYLAERETERDREVRRSQNEAAEKVKGLTAKEQAVEQARQQYETALPILLQNLQSGMAGEFGDIRTMADVQKLAQEDWPRYIKWDAQQKQVAAVHQELQASQARQADERNSKWSSYAEEQDKLLAEKAPELSDKERGQKVRDAALDYLKDVGFTEKELATAWRGEKDIPFRDHRVQMLILDGIRYREAQSKAKTVTAKPLPPVQRPGVSPGKGAATEARVQTLTKQLPNAKGLNAVRAAAELYRARRH